MGSRQLRVRVVDKVYSIVTAADPVVGNDGLRYRSQVDHEQATIWLDPAVPRWDRERVIVHSVALAWSQRLELVPVVD